MPIIKIEKVDTGVLYNRRGEVDYEGWWEDEVMEVNNDVNVITNHTGSPYRSRSVLQYSELVFSIIPVSVAQGNHHW